MTEPTSDPGAAEVPADLFDAAKIARGNAYAPYSKFPVGAALRTEGGAVFAGANMENAAYPQGQCAEANALGAMVSAGGGTRIVEVVVIGGRADAPEDLCTPCGGCRQKLREFAADTLIIHICGPEGLRRTVTLGSLLPLSFGPENLDTD